ncbi:MAG: glycosyltransferase family 2 protein, partial [Candidatus Korobacteraceae bacterium]
MNPDPVISVVVPCFNEAQVISACYERLTQVLAGTGESYEIVFVDDGSTDETALLLCGIRDRDPHVVVLRLSRNFGQSAATSAGLDAALGQAVVTIDADLQDPPELISEMLGLWRQGYQLVYGIRETRFGETWFKVMSSRLFNGLLSRLANVYIAPNSGEFRLMDRCVVQAIRRMPERHRMLRGMAAWVGFRQAGLH